MATAYNSLVVQQLQDRRPSPTLEVSRTLDVNSSYSPGHTPCPSIGPSHNSHNNSDKDYFSHSNHKHTYEQYQRQAITRPNSEVLDTAAPPSTPITSPLRSKPLNARTTTTLKNNTTTISTPTSKHQRVASQNGLPSIQVTRTPTSGVLSQPLASSPKGVSDVFSLSSDKQLSAQYWFHEEIGYGNWVSPLSYSYTIYCHSTLLISLSCILHALPLRTSSLIGLGMEDPRDERRETRNGSQVNLQNKRWQDYSSSC